MHLRGFEVSLRRCIFGILAAGTPVVACGSVNDPCKNSPCCGNPPPAQTYTATYTQCPPIVVDAGDEAAADADVEAGDASDAGDASEDAAPPLVCFESCDQACNAQRPYGQGGVPFCQSSDAGAGDGGQMIANCELMMLCGRRFDGLDDVACEGRRADGTPSLGSFLAGDFARAAWLEAASIHAFRRLARELRAHGAPEELVAAARSAAKDEARHARVMARLAKRRGAKVPRVVYEELPIRDLESIARENAVEACVGETYGALVAEWHARHARDAEVRDAMRAIAPDEMRHAALGWAVDAWARTRLSDDARARVTAARDEAARDLLQNASIAPDAMRLASAMHTEIWA